LFSFFSLLASSTSRPPRRHPPPANISTLQAKELDLRAFPLVIGLLLLLTGCAGSTENVLPVSPSIRGASFVRESEIIVRRNAVATVAASDEKSSSGTGGPPPFAEMLSEAIKRVTLASGLSSGRALKLIVEVDSLRAPPAGAAFFGADDELAGSVFIRDANNGAELGQLYLKVGRVNGGLASVIIRGGGVREQLAEAFARRIAEALGGRRIATR